jgi:hypothetical protein
MGIDLSVPDHTTISRRAACLTPVLRTALPTVPFTLVIDSTGLKVYGADEWHRESTVCAGGEPGASFIWRSTWRPTPSLLPL